MAGRGRGITLQVLPREESEFGMDFFRLAKALPALYPKDSEEKKFLDAMLLAMLRG